MRISRRHFFFGTLAVPVFADKKPAARPNVVVILVDNLPAWTLGIYGNKEIQTPNIDRLAQTGTRFLRHFACTAAPAEGRDTLLTGKTPMQPAGAATIDKILGGLGYAGGSVDEAVPGTPFCAIVHFTSLKPPYDGVA
ncbi:MAG TPA: sulfatase-like hydrolase/transferase [Bryobacteraceae bacterium]